LIRGTVCRRLKLLSYSMISIGGLLRCFSYKALGTRHKARSASWTLDCSLTFVFEVVVGPHPANRSVEHGDDSRLTCIMSWRGIKQSCSCEQECVQRTRESGTRPRWRGWQHQTCHRVTSPVPETNPEIKPSVCPWIYT
jgi:hypothetical protein